MTDVAGRRQFLRAAGLAAVWPRISAAAARPNVILLLSDDQGYGDLSCLGHPVLKTPALDALHRESVRFTDFHAAPMCTPTRGQLLSGQDALHNGATSVTAGRAVLRRSLPTMADVFASAGYATGMFGKWHLGDNYPYRPMDRGFQAAKYFLGYGLSSAPEFDNDYFNGRYRNNGVSDRFSGYCTDFWFDEAIAWMSQHGQRRQPFFCYLPLNAPHTPPWVAEKYSAPYRKPGLPANYYGMIANLDENVAKLELFLRDSGLRENTILIFMSDNGAISGVRVFNAGMRGRKAELYEGGHRVPCFVRWPAGKLRPPADIETPAQMQDVLPTLVDLCGLEKPRGANFDGASLAGLLRGEAKPLADRMLVVQYGQTPKKWESAVIWNRWRLVNGAELYELGADPAQANDVSARNPEIVQRMRGHYEKWWTRVEPGLSEFLPISIGSEKENPATLAFSDWQAIYFDDPQDVLEANGGPRGGEWSVWVEQSGEYEVLLYRWPAHTGLALTAAFPERKLTMGKLPAGKALPIAGARLTLAGQSLSVKTAATDRAARFRLKLAGGVKTQLHGWFQDAAGNDLCGAYYVGVLRV